MLKQVEETSPTTRKLEINIPSSVIEKEISNAYNKLRSSAKIPGFRVGKVPQSILEKKFGKDVEAQVLEKIVPEFYTKAVQEAHIVPISFPDIGGTLKLVKNQPLSFTATVEVKPEIKDLTYEGIALKEKTFTVEENEVDTALKTLQESRAILNVTEGPVKEGDMAVIDYNSFIDNKEINELQTKDYPFIIGSHALPKEFTDALSGKKTGDTFEMNIHFEKDLPNKTVAGKDVLFKVSVKEMKERILPQLDDEFAKGFNFNSTDELKKHVRENLGKRKESRRDSEYKKEIVDHLINNNSLETPHSLVQKELESLIDEAKQNSLSQGQAVKTDEELRKEYEPAANKNVKTMLILDAIGQKEKIEVTEDDVNRAVEEVAAQHQIKPDEVKKLYITQEGSLNGLKHRLYSGKVLDLVLSRADIKTVADERS
jgi:trigger factor